MLSAQNNYSEQEQQIYETLAKGLNAFVALNQCLSSTTPQDLQHIDLAFYKTMKYRQDKIIHYFSDFSLLRFGHMHTKDIQEHLVQFVAQWSHKT